MSGTRLGNRSGLSLGKPRIGSWSSRSRSRQVGVSRSVESSGEPQLARESRGAAALRWCRLPYLLQPPLAWCVFVCLVGIACLEARFRYRCAHALPVPPRVASEVYQVDINRASWEEFTVLPGVGETMARRVVAERERRGPFQAVDDLMRVRGIGERTVQRLAKHLVVTSPAIAAPSSP